MGALGRQRHRRRFRFIAQDALDGVDPARVALISAPEPVLAAPEEDGGEPRILEVGENAADG